MKCHLPVTRRSTRKFQIAMSVLDTLIAMSIASIVFAAVGSLSLFTARSFVAMGNYAELDRASRNALDIMTRDIREAKSLVSYSTNQVAFTNGDGTAFSYTYSPGMGTLTRSFGGLNKVLLYNCDYLYFSISQRNPTNNFVFPYQPTSQVTLTKLVDVSWKCSRQIFGKKVNTESVQTAKIVIRN